MKEVWWVVITIGLIIFGAAFVNTFGQGFADQSIAADGSTSNVTAGTGSTENFNQNAIDIVFNPKVLGLMTLFLMLVAAVALLTASPGKK